MSILKYWKSVVCFAWMPLYIGGSSESDSHTDTTNNTTNNVSSADKRIVASDAAVAVSGNANTVNRNESTSFADSSNRSTTTNYTTTDFGSVVKAIDGIGQMGTQVTNLSRDAISGAIDSLNRTGNNQLDALHSVFDFAAKSSANSLTSANEALGFAKDTIAQSNAAFSEAKNGPDKSIIMMLLGVVGVIGAAFVFKAK